ncbi:MAG: universal stress protein [Desulfobacterales bacterium]
MENNDEKIEVRKILLPLKFSQAGSRAFSMALCMAKCCMARLDILSVLKPDPSWDLAEEAHFEKEVDTEFKRFKETHSHLLSNFNNSHFAWQLGNPATEILKYAEGESADLIILGVHYRNDKPCYNRLGEVAQRVFQLAPCAVMLVPSGFQREKTSSENAKHLRKRIWEGNEP